MRKECLVFSLGLLVILTLGSCKQDIYESQDMNVNESKLVTFSFKSRATSSVSADLNPLKASDLNFYFFDLNKSKEGELVHVTQAQKVQVIEDNGVWPTSSYLVEVSIPQSQLSDNVYVVILTGESMLQRNSLLGTSLTEFNRKRIFYVEQDELHSMPMCGSVKVDLSINSSPINFKMLRSYARVNVKLLEHDVTKKYQMEEIRSVRVYLPKSYGSAIPFEENYDEVLQKVHYPSIPQGVGELIGEYITDGGTTTSDKNIAIENPLIYDFGSGVSEVYDAIFLAESDAKDGTFSDVVCLVIGVKLKGVADTRYYRVDFTDYQSAENAYLSLLRNRSYNIELAGATEKGEDNPSDAYKAKSTALVNITPWEDYEIPVSILESFYFKMFDTADVSWRNNEPLNVYFTTDLPYTVVKSNIEISFRGVDGSPIAFELLEVDGTTIKLRTLRDNNTGKDMVNFMDVSILGRKMSIRIVQSADKLIEG